MSQPILKTSAFLFGGDYNPEQWPETTWPEDVRLMREAGVTCVSLGIFAWARCEPRPGMYDFAWLDRVVELLHGADIRICLATATVSPPPWFSKRYPESLPISAEGILLGPGSRRYYCPHSTAYHEHSLGFVRQLAQRYGAHPAVIAWHVDNEYASHFSECFCDASQAAFRSWLQHRYGTLAELNLAWGTTFWGQIYGDWEEIPAPRRTPYLHNPALLLDWKRFSSDSWLACYNAQRTLLRELTPHVPVTTNFMGFFQPLDYWAWAAAQDIVSNDCYPDPADPNWMIENAMAADLMRSLKHGQPWLLLEQATTHVNWRPQNAAKRPGQMRIGNYQALARGANGLMFFQWRASLAGGEQLHSAMVQHGGTTTRVWCEVVRLGAELRRLSALLPGRVEAQAAFLLDWESWWALSVGNTLSDQVDLLRHIRALYAPLFAGNITVDFAHPSDDLSRYKLVIAPHLYLAGEATGPALERFVAEGGTLLVSYLSGIVNERGQVRLGGYPASLRALLGLWVEEFSPHVRDETHRVTLSNQLEAACATWSDVINLEGAEAIAHYADGYLAGRPAVTRHRFGRGYAFYLGTSLNATGLQWLLNRVCAESGVQPVLVAPPGVEVGRRCDETRVWYVLINHTASPVEVSVPPHGRELLSHTQIDGALPLGPNDVAVVEYVT
jgi:beta-galactosidase